MKDSVFQSTVVLIYVFRFSDFEVLELEGVDLFSELKAGRAGGAAAGVWGREGNSKTKRGRMMKLYSKKVYQFHFHLCFWQSYDCEDKNALAGSRRSRADDAG